MYKVRRLNNNINLTEKIIFNILILTLSFLSSRIMIIGNFPLGISIVSSLQNVISSWLGAFMGYFSLKNVSLSVRYVATMIAVIFMRILFKDLKKSDNFIMYSIIVNFIPNFTTGIASKMAYGLNLRSFFECFLESLISMMTSYFLMFASNLITEKKEKFNIFIFPFVAFLISSPFINVKIFSINIFNIVNIITLLYFSYFTQIIGGSFCGILQAVVYMLLKPEAHSEIISFPILGMISGFSSRFGKLFMISIYMISNLTICKQINSNIDQFYFIEIIVGISAFIYLSKKIKIRNNKIHAILHPSHNIMSLVIQNISILKNVIVNSKKVFNNISFNTDQNFKSDSKNLVNSYLDGMSKICESINNSIDLKINEGFSHRIENFIKKAFSVNSKVNFGENKSNKIVLQIEFYRFDVPNDLEKLREEICFIIGKSFMKFEIFENDSSTILRTCEKPSLHPRLFYKQHVTNGEKYCGDSFKSFCDGLGKFYVIMCDGMGTGNNAAISGNMTSEVIKNMIRGGIDFKTSISIANSLLMSKSKDESLSTVDIFALDLYSGDAEFIKAGAASSFIRKGREIAKISSDTFPIGILSEFSVSKTHCKLEKEDLVFIVSDGITDTGEDWIENMIRDEFNIIELNDKILNQAIKLREEENDDDITSIMIKI